MATTAQREVQPARTSVKLQKGFTAAYPTQSSIPYKYQPKYISLSEKKGFNSQSRRFDQRKDNIPGPGSYDVTHQSPVFSSVSLSTRGTCAFSSRRDRMGPIVSKNPAANAYTLPSCFVSKKDFSNTGSSMFQMPAFGRGLKFETPAPNQYNASVSSCKLRSNVCARAEFQSKTKRGVFTIPGGPAPGHYYINESLVKQSPTTLVSCFKSKTDRGIKLTSTVPGPGYYNPHDHIKIPKKTFIPKNPILNFSRQPMSLPLRPSLPGPGQYEIVDYEGPPKYLISSASFVSNTKRWSVVPTQTGLPGPATYRPELPGKQSFLYNEGNRWIPVL